MVKRKPIKHAKRPQKGITSLGQLTPDPRNARKHTPRNVGSIVDALHKVGAARSIVIDEHGVILAGNATVEAAGEAGIEKVQVVDVDGQTLVAVRRTGLSAKQKTELAILDNRAAELAEWNVPELKALVQEFDISLPDIAFDDKEFAALGAGDPAEVTEDEVPTDAPARCKAGDLWLLGEHRLLCGDSTKGEDVGRVMGGERAALCFTSPPYDQQRDYTAESKAKGLDWSALMRGAFGNLPMADDGQVLVNLGLIHRDGEWQPYWDGWIEWMREQGWRRFGWYVWDQGPGMPGDWSGRFAPSHEFVFHFNQSSVKPTKARECLHAGEAHGGKGQRAASGEVKARSAGVAPVQSHAILDSVIRVNRQGAAHDAAGHPAPYPVGLPASAIKSWSGDVYDPFLGSGTTIIAAEQLGRRCFGLEISPKYCDIILQRWENLTGNKARREGDF